ncbi:MAG: hypothetical protein R3D58_05530 [Saprospiraceae bacterium]|jgi:hypothetical protein|nr:hypothetical protein [Lewinellaceae bacterium]
MKTIRITLSLLIFAFILPAATVRASEEVPASAARMEMVKKAAAQKDQIAKAFKAEKKALKFKLFKKKGNRVDFSDPVDKWMWFWIFGWAAGLLLSILAAAVTTGGIYSGSFGFGAVLFTFAWLAWLFGSVCLIVWLVKKFGGA